jgi:hypothetical protein
VSLRAQTLAVLREGWTLASIGVAANLLLTYLILLAALRFVGVTATELSAAEACRLRDRVLGRSPCFRSRAAASGSWTPS